MYSTSSERIRAVFDFFMNHDCKEFVFVGYAGKGKTKRIVFNITETRGPETITMLDMVKEEMKGKYVLNMGDILKIQ